MGCDGSHLTVAWREGEISMLHETTSESGSLSLTFRNWAMGFVGWFGATKSELLARPLNSSKDMPTLTK